MGAGETFSASVAEALREFGLEIVEGPRGRADLLAYDGKRLFAFELKGLEGSAREANLRQTERWVADVMAAMASTAEERAADKDLHVYAEKLKKLGVPETGSTENIDCKGVMIIGTHRKIPIVDRIEPSFPDPVARPINRSAVCALSGLQLFGLLLGTRSNQITKSEVLDDLCSTNGLLDKATDWRAFLTKEDITAG